MADRYWRGGTGTWNTSSTTNWSATSGGLGGASVPTAADSVFFNDDSGTGTITLTGALACLSLNISRTSGTLTFTGTGTIACSGSLNVSGTTGVTWTATGLITFNATSARTITTNGLIFACPFTFNGVGGSWQFQDNFTSASTSTAVVTLTAGTLDFNARTMNFFRFVSSGTGVRAIIATGATVNITGNASTVLDFTTITNLTLTGWACTFTYAGPSGNRTISLAAFTEVQAFNIVINGGSDVVILSGTMRDLNLTGFGGTLNSSSRTLFGNLTLGTSTTVADGAAITAFVNTSGTTTIDTKGRTFSQIMQFSQPGGTRRLLGNLSLGSRGCTLNGGNLDLNDFTLAALTMNTTLTNAKQIQFGNTGTINLTGSSATVWSFGTATGFSYTGNAVVNLTYAGAIGTRLLQHGSIAGGSDATKAPPMYFATGATDIVSTPTGGFFSDLIFAAGANVTFNNTVKNIYGNLIFNPGMNIVAGSSNIVFAGNIVQTFDSANLILDFPIVIGTGTSNGNLRLANTTTTGNARTLTLSSGTLDLNGRTLNAGYFSSSITATRAIYQNSGTFNVAGFNTTIWNMGTATGFGYPTRPVVNFTYDGSVGTRTVNAVSAGGSYSNSIDFNVIAGSDTLAVGNCNANDLNFAGFTGTLTNATRSLYGNLTLDAGMTAANGVGAMSFIGTTGNQTLVTNGVSTDFPIIIQSTGGNFVLSEPLEIGSSRSLTVTSGNLLANGYNITAGQLSISNSNLRRLDIGNITLNLTGNGTVFTAAISTNATLITPNSTILLSDNTTANRSFGAGNLTYNNLIIGGDTATSNITFTGNGTFNTISSTKTVAHRVIFTAGSTTTVNDFAITGTAGNVVTITSDTANAHTLVHPGGDTVNAISYLNISYSDARPITGIWFAGINSINSGNNTGWVFQNSNDFLI